MFYNFPGYDRIRNFTALITAVIDARGSAYEGDKFMHTLYRRLGQLEPVDQVEVVQHILAEHNFINPDKTAIYGWSYGGYATAHTLGYGENLIIKIVVIFHFIVNFYQNFAE